MLIVDGWVLACGCRLVVDISDVPLGNVEWAVNFNAGSSVYYRQTMCTCT